MKKFTVSAPVTIEMEIEAESEEEALSKFAEAYCSGSEDYTLGEYDDDWVIVEEVKE